MPATVVIADDSLFMRTLLRRLLAPLDVDVVAEAENGAEAIEAYVQYKPDLLLLDITMPGTNGVTAAKRILESDPQARIIVCSAMAATHQGQETLAYGVRDLITKPFDAETVHTKVRQVLAECGR